MLSSRSKRRCISCPTDRQGFWKAGEPDGTLYSRSRGNYVIDWGYADFTQTQPTGYKAGPFGPNIYTRVADVRDGLSNTMFMSEVIQAVNDTDYDFRGDFFNDDTGAAEFMTYNTPNSGYDMLPICPTPATEPAPCSTTSKYYYVTARSKHPGGVTVAFGDGSVHFMSDTIAVNTWRSLSSKAGDEAVSGGDY